MKTKTTKKIKLFKPKVAKKVVDTPQAPTTFIPEYTASIKIFGKVYTSQGSSLKECVENLKVGKVGGVCVMTVTHGDAKREKILNAGQLFRLFSSSRIMHEMAMKNVCNLFGDI